MFIYLRRIYCGRWYIKMKLKITIKIILIILLIGLILSQSISAVNYCNLYLKKEISEKTDKLDNYYIYSLCYVESGDVDHDQFSFYERGFFWPNPPGFGIGRIGLDLKGWRNETRLTVKSIYGTIVYDCDVHIDIRGFIGYAWPTVSVYGGILKGRALIAKISPLV
jgi:hypothetical protein